MLHLHAARLPGDEQHDRFQGFEGLVRCVSCVAGAQRTDGSRLVAAQRMVRRGAYLCQAPRSMELHEVCRSPDFQGRWSGCAARADARRTG